MDAAEDRMLEKWDNRVKAPGRSRALSSEDIGMASLHVRQVFWLVPARSPPSRCLLQQWLCQDWR